jgi:flavin-binding protein dodecin
MSQCQYGRGLHKRKPAGPDSWEAAARNAVETAGRTIRDLRVAEATRFDVTVKDGKIADYRVRLDISFKYEAGD